MKQNGCLIFNAAWVGAMYAGAEFNKKLQAEDWCKAYFYRTVSEEQLKEARDLGVRIAGMIKAGRLKPPHPLGRFGPLLDSVSGWFMRD